LELFRAGVQVALAAGPAQHRPQLGLGELGGLGGGGGRGEDGTGFGVKNQRLAAVGHVWAFASLRAPGPRAHYDHRRAAGGGGLPGR
jgi:hypothetical protein